MKSLMIRTCRDCPHREFIEKALVETGAPEDWGDMFGTLYDAGFKAPESEE